jgi:arabinofuranosyltransferase
MTSKKTLTLDLLISLLLIASTFYYAVRYVDFSIPPFEDAAMLMRYAQHLADGHGIVWNIGQHPVDGATDFLFMVVSAAFIKLGLTVGQSVRGIGFASHLLTVLLVYWTNRRVNNGTVLLSFLSGLYLVVGTGLSYVAAYFGTPFFALAAASTWTLGLILIQKENPHFGLILAFALSGLVTGLIRPEGVVLASLMLLAVAMLRGFKNSKSIIVTFGVVFLVLGGAYILWRWN